MQSKLTAGVARLNRNMANMVPWRFYWNKIYLNCKVREFSFRNFSFLWSKINNRTTRLHTQFNCWHVKPLAQWTQIKCISTTYTTIHQDSLQQPKWNTLTTSNRTTNLEYTRKKTIWRSTYNTKTNSNNSTNKTYQLPVNATEQNSWLM
jgi:hypothetical protein